MNDSKAVVSSPRIYDAGQLDQAEYEALETALLQTARGRNFLSEYLHRNGGEAETGIVETDGEPLSVSNDTDMILRAVERLHSAVMDNQGAAGVDHVRMDILEMSKAISKTRSEITAMRTDGDYDHLTVASEEMDAIVQSTEKATNDILQAAEKIQEVAWRLREAGTDDAACEEIDNYATDIYMACSFQDLTGQRTTKVVRVLQYLEARINSMIEIWGLSDENGGADSSEGENGGDGAMDKRPDAHLLNGPQKQEMALEQDNIDALLGNDAFSSDNIDHQEAEGGESADMSETELVSESEIDDIFNDASSDEPIDEEQLKSLFS